MTSATDTGEPPASASERRSRARRRGHGSGIRPATAVSALGAAVLLLAVVAGLMVGLRSFDVRTASMGQAAPVGSLVVTGPLGAHRLAVGDLVTFVPPTTTASSTTYTHRILSIDDGRMRTKGDANGAADAWTIDRGDVVGRVLVVLPGVGWLVRTAPWLAVGVGVVWFATGFLGAATNRAAARVLGCSGVVAAVVTGFRPLVGLQTLGTDSGSDAVVHLVSTGLLPVEAVGPDGASLRLVSGQSGALVLPTGTDGPVQIAARLDLSPLGWAGFAVVCGLPLVAAFLLARTRAAARTAEQP